LIYHQFAVGKYDVHKANIYCQGLGIWCMLPVMVNGIIETTVERAAAEFQRRGLGPKDRITVMMGPERDLLARARSEARALVAADGLTDADIDALIEEARADVARQRE
jgi:hypothetical protein